MTEGGVRIKGKAKQIKMKCILLIAAIYITSYGQCQGEKFERAGIVRRINDSHHHHQLRGSSNTEKIGQVALCDLVVDDELHHLGREGYNPDDDDVDQTIGESVWFYGTNLPPNCTDSDDEQLCNIILSDSPSCHDEDVFQRSKTIRQMHYITDHRGCTGDTEWHQLYYRFSGMPALISRTASVHFTDQTGKRVACAIIESEEDSGKLFFDGYNNPSSEPRILKDITKKVVGASIVREGPQNWQDPLSYNLVPE